MHVIRLLNEGIELMRSGTVTQPRPEKELLITIRTAKLRLARTRAESRKQVVLRTGTVREQECVAGEGGQKQNLPQL